jgi:hypothetical protein
MISSATGEELKELPSSRWFRDHARGVKQKDFAGRDELALITATLGRDSVFLRKADLHPNFELLFITELGIKRLKGINANLFFTIDTTYGRLPHSLFLTTIMVDGVDHALRLHRNESDFNLVDSAISAAEQDSIIANRIMIPIAYFFHDAQDAGAYNRLCARLVALSGNRWQPAYYVGDFGTGIGAGIKQSTTHTDTRRRALGCMPSFRR